MQWLLLKAVDGTNRRFVKYKCGNCGTTAELQYETADEPLPRPVGWTTGRRKEWHFCPECEKPRQKKPNPLPVVYA